MKQGMFRKTAFALASAALLTASAAHADTLTMVQNPNSLGFTATINGTSKSVTAGNLSVNDLTTSTSFVAYCYELVQGVLNTAINPGMAFTATPVTGELQTLFNQSYAGLSTWEQRAGFQIAIWEVLDDKNLSSGAYTGWAGTNASATNALGFANTYLSRLGSGFAATGNYALTAWTNGTSQDVIQATANTVPEPGSAVLGALGLAGIGLIRRRLG